MVSGDVRITLTLQQQSGSMLTGFLESSNGNRFMLEGAIEYGVASGVCRMEQGGVFFEAYLDGNDLTLSLIEPDEYNMPNYDKAQYLVLSRGSGQYPSPGQAVSPLDQLTGTGGNTQQAQPYQQSQYQQQPQYQQQAQPYQQQGQYPQQSQQPGQFQQQAQTPYQMQAGTNRPYNQPQQQSMQNQASTPAPAPPNSGFPLAAKGSEQVKDEINGYAFTKPAGWNHQLSEGYILLGSNTIPGLILTFPHQSGSMGAMIQEMGTGIQEEGVNLSLRIQVQQQSASLATCYYTRIVQAEQAKAYGIGVLNPQGGGLFILAVSPPDKLGNEIIAAANTISANTTFMRPKTGDQDLVRHFSGEWAWSNGYRTEWMMFYPDGSFSDQYEAAYSGNTSDGWGNQTGAWGATNQSSSKGRWNIQGTRDAGVITVISPDGSQTQYNYKVFVERGEKYYREYMFNNYHFRKNKDF